MIDLQTKVTFDVSLGYARANKEETFTLEELGYEPIQGTPEKVELHLYNFLDELWTEWSTQYVLGGFMVEGLDD